MIWTTSFFPLGGKRGAFWSSAQTYDSYGSNSHSCLLNRSTCDETGVGIWCFCLCFPSHANLMQGVRRSDIFIFRLFCLSNQKATCPTNVMIHSLFFFSRKYKKVPHVSQWEESSATIIASFMLHPWHYRIKVVMRRIVDYINLCRRGW